MALRDRPWRCQECNSLMGRIMVTRFFGKAWDANKVYTNFSDEPMRFATENDLRQHCRKTKLSSGALL